MVSETAWVMEDEEGLLWVGVTQKRGPTMPVGIIEVIDPVRGELLAAMDQPAAFTPEKRGWGWIRKQSAEGYFSFDIVKLSLRRN
jgi:hypothetical protein